jgi:hypothetical protein
LAGQLTRLPKEFLGMKNNMPIRVFINKETQRAAIVPEDKCGGTGGVKIAQMIADNPSAYQIIAVPDSLLDEISAGNYEFSHGGTTFYITGS